MLQSTFSVNLLQLLVSLVETVNLRPAQLFLSTINLFLEVLGLGQSSVELLGVVLSGNTALLHLLEKIHAVVNGLFIFLEDLVPVFALGFLGLLGLLDFLLDGLLA